MIFAAIQSIMFNAFLQDDEWIVYDTRNNDTMIGIARKVSLK